MHTYKNIENIVSCLDGDVDVLIGNVVMVSEEDRFEFVQDNAHIKK